MRRVTLGPMTTPPNTILVRLLAWFAVLAGLATMAAPTLQGDSPLLSLNTLLCLVLGALSLVAGVYGLRARPWAYGLLGATYLVQSMEYQSDLFTLSLMGPVAIQIALVWQSPPSRFSLNIVAIMVGVLAARAALAARRQPPRANR